MGNTAKIEVLTPLGTLVAEPSTDPDYPGIWVSLRNENGFELNMALVEYENFEEDPNKGKWITRVWGDAFNEDYTNITVHTDIDRWIAEVDT